MHDTSLSAAASAPRHRTGGAPRRVDQAARDDLARRVIGQLADHIRDACRYAPAYAEGYAEAVLTNRSGRPRPANLRPEIAALVRELTLDEIATTRRR